VAKYQFYVTKADFQPGRLACTHHAIHVAFGGMRCISGITMETSNILISGLKDKFKNATYQKWILVGYVELVLDRVALDPAVLKVLTSYLVPINETVNSVDDIGLARWAEKGN